MRSAVTPSVLAMFGSAPRETRSFIPSISPTSAHFQNGVTPAELADSSEKLYSLYHSSFVKRALGLAPRSRRLLINSIYPVFSYFVVGCGWKDLRAHCV